MQAQQQEKYIQQLEQELRQGNEALQRMQEDIAMQSASAPSASAAAATVRYSTSRATTYEKMNAYNKIRRY
jgi:phage baseplate assembly protein gpV